MICCSILLSQWGFRQLMHHEQRFFVVRLNLSVSKPTHDRFRPQTREYTDWRMPLSCVHSVMRCFRTSLVRVGGGGGDASPPPMTLSTPRLELLYQSVCRFVRIGSHAPLPPVSVLPPWNQRGGQHSLGGEGAGGANSDDWRESPALCSLCVPRFLHPPPQHN